MSWLPGDHVVMRQVWQSRPWAAVPHVVVSDEPGLLATYVPGGAPFGFAEGDFPGGVHPWAHRTHWEGHGVLTLRRPDDRYSIWVFWQGAERAFWGWYVNLEQPYRRSAIGFDTLDNELDIWSEDAVTWHLKDEEAVDERVAEGRFDAAEAEQIRADAAAFLADVDRAGPWWDPAWSEWTPPPGLEPPQLPPGWERVPAT